MTATGNRVLRAHRSVREDLRDKSYDPGRKPNPGNAGKGGKGPAFVIRSATKRPKAKEAERIEIVGRLAEAFQAAGTVAEMLAVADDAEAAGMGDLALVYRRQAAG